MEQLKDISATARSANTATILEWFQAQTAGSSRPVGPPIISEDERQKRQQEQREQETRDLKKQQEINRRLTEITKGEPHTIKGSQPAEALLQQLKAALTGKKEEDPNKALLKALLSSHNKPLGKGELTH